MPNSKQIILRDGRFFVQNITETDIGTQDKVLREHSAAIPYDVPNNFVVNGQPINVQFSGQNVVGWCEVLKLNLSTVWTIVDGGLRFPVFKKPDRMQSPPEHEAMHVISPIKAGMRLFFVNQMQWHDGEKCYQWLNSYLVARGSRRKEFFRPPLPNIHSDGKICMGTYQAISPCLADLFSHSLNHFNSSKWNSDLIEGLGQDVAKALYSIKDNDQLPPPAAFKFFEQRICAPINSTAYGELPIPTF